MLKRLFNLLNQKIIKHNIIVLTVFTLIVLLSALVFLYKNFYQPMNDIAEIFTLKGQVNFTAIDEKSFNEAYDGIRQKNEQPSVPLDNFNSPF
ncbi:hypothetical protein COU00_01725 [Candidatus Falkowbacteria bacterium CG10_big_fil_rev_8_21_14_0_10_43_11]|uniref:Polysaccharide chain length determinant N-terminal domain-containing protein n=1 Tax=Candidatus Falkowbacteria bacterium CG10_big_fil_rev_8_21_14_0_10_43_11 TaxID=1974568 RepID=A0A2M6WME1_9BACT|nr:MAG: hypothetical protein COU00_01725 [Candidatus Falkowbacteria bacterium CG10_big_fil_rev_8_21_14_0_10_43_11]